MVGRRRATSVDRANRVRFAVLGLVLLAAAVALTVMSAQTGGVGQPGDWYIEASTWARRNVVAAYSAIAGAGLLLLLFGLWLIRWQLDPPGARLHTLTIEDTDAGETTVEASAVASAFAADLRRLPKVLDARARLVGAGANPHVLIWASVSSRADLMTVRSSLEQAYERLKGHLGAERVRADVHLTPVVKRPSRVS